MKIVRFADSITVKYGLLEGNLIKGLRQTPFADDWNPQKPILDETEYDLREVMLLPPCEPTKYIGVGINFKESAEALGFPVPERPLLFYKPITSIIGTGEKVVFPPGDDVTLIFEGELGVVLQRKAKGVKPEHALDYVLGYTCINDVTDLSAMKPDHGNFFRAKSADTFGPVGPCISSDVDPGSAEICSWVNGELHQSGNTKDLIFNVRYLISYISNFMTLMPGDIIATGTPPGNRPVRAGETVTVGIEGIGILENFYGRA